ncbi:MAG: bacteriohemerythrin [Clostridiales bacterium]|nr:bacteriohemerythrin [Clostridiales bacterium]
MYQFTDDCLIGVKQLDNEHRELFRIINEAMSLLGNEWKEDKYDDLVQILKELKEYTQYHFQHEEKYMEEIHHPELPVQKRQHREFTAKINELDAIVDFREQQEVLDELLKYLVTWLYRHILGSDIMIGKMEPVENWGRDRKFVLPEEYYTGIDFVDEEHKELFRIIDDVNHVIMNDYVHDKYDEIVRLLEELKNYTQYHFQDEEKYMEQIGYSGLEAQKRAHSAFISRLEELDLEEADDHQQQTLEGLMEFLTEWLVNHILHMDKKIKGA